MGRQSCCQREASQDLDLETVIEEQQLTINALATKVISHILEAAGGGRGPVLYPAKGRGGRDAGAILSFRG